MIKYLLIFLSILLLIGCKSKKVILPEETVNSRYLYVEKIAPKDTFAILAIPPAVQANISELYSLLENQFSRSEVTIDTATGKFIHILEQKEQEIEVPIQILEKVIYVKNDTIITKYVKVPVIEYQNKLYTWQIILMCLGASFIAAAIIYTTVKLKK